MCDDCWADYGRPQPTAAARVVAALIENLYDLAGTGGAAHIVTDDWNLEDTYIDWCLKDECLDEYSPNPEAREAARIALLALRSLDESQRAAALAVQEHLV